MSAKLLNKEDGEPSWQRMNNSASGAAAHNLRSRPIACQEDAKDVLTMGMILTTEVPIAAAGTGNTLQLPVRAKPSE